MPTLQLVASLAEGTLNRVLALDENSEQRMRPLAGKQLKLSLLELPASVLFCFSDRVDVLIVSASEQVDADCSLALSLSTLSRLQDSSQISQLIQNQQLQLDGDIHVAQHFSQLLALLSIDWEELLSGYTGDVVAHQLFRFGKDTGAALKRGWSEFNNVISSVALEERPVAAHPIAVSHFSDQVNDVRSQADRLEARISRLEAKQEN